MYTTIGQKTRAAYSHTDIIANFQALLDSYNFKGDVAALALPTFALAKKKIAIRELQVAAIALWYLALQRSFPTDYDAIFALFRQESAFFCEAKDPAILQNRLNIYLDVIQDKKETNFSPIALYMTDIIHPTADDALHVRLKLSLLLRKLYTLIFDKLV